MPGLVTPTPRNHAGNCAPQICPRARKGQHVAVPVLGVYLQKPVVLLLLVNPSPILKPRVTQIF